MAKYKRVLIKLSGEALGDHEAVARKVPLALVQKLKGSLGVRCRHALYALNAKRQLHVFACAYDRDALRSA